MKYMASITSLENFSLYQESLTLVVNIFELCKSQPLSRNYSLQDQIKRASISISANLAEGFGRYSRKDFAHFLSISLGSVNEVRCYLDIISLLSPHTDVNELKEKCIILSKRIHTLRQSLVSQRPQEKS